jgi:hypothetical protein
LRRAIGDAAAANNGNVSGNEGEDNQQVDGAMVKLAGVRMGKLFAVKDGKVAKRFVPRDASQAARWRKKPQTVRVQRHQKRGG